MDLELQGRVAVVTGASAGIGWATSLALASEGARVLAVARRADALGELAGSSNGDIIPVVGDVRSSATHDEIARRIEEIGPLDVLVNNAGRSTPIAVDAPEEDWEAAMDLNYVAARRLTTALRPHFAAQVSVINLCGAVEAKSYNAAFPAKAALAAWTKMLATELGPQGVRANGVAPGRVISEQLLDFLHPDPEERLAFGRAHIPLGYMAEPHTVADLICFLASPRSSYITGELIRVDGGLHKGAF